MFENGTVRTRFGHWPGTPTYSSEGTPAKEHKEPTVLPIEEVPLHIHMVQWLKCIRRGTKPPADMELGYKQGVAVIMGDMSYSVGRKVIYDKNTQEVRPG